VPNLVAKVKTVLMPITEEFTKEFQKRTLYGSLWLSFFISKCRWKVFWI